MRLRTMLSLAGRAVFAAIALLTACYCMIAYFPFTYQQVHKGGLLRSAEFFVRYHPWFCLVAAVALAAAVGGRVLRRGPGRRLAAGLLVFQVAAGVVLLRYPLLSGLENNIASFYWALGALLPLIWLAVADITAFAGTVQWEENPARQTGKLWLAAAATGLYVPGVYAVVVWLRRDAALRIEDGLPLFALSFAAQLVLGLALFLALEWLTALAGLFRKPAQAQFWLFHLLMACGAAAFLRWIVSPALGQPDWSTNILAAALGAVLAALNAGVALWLQAGQPASDGLAAGTRALRLGFEPQPWTGAAALLVLGAAACGLTVSAAAMDWNFLMQTAIAAVLWLVAFAWLYAIAPGPRRDWHWLPLCAVFAVLGLYKWIEPPAAAAARTEAWSGYDISLRLARKILVPAPGGDGSFYQFVSQNTNIPASVVVAPVDLKLAELTGPSGRKRPHIFLIVVDSLRRDYLSPYNGAVTFTPAIGNFARDSVVFRNAFSRYGGTGLSEPSIWTGAMMLHKQYITPFGPMNSLQKLLRAEGYQDYVSRDSVLRAILAPDPAILDLDLPDSTMTYQLDRSLGKLEEELGRRAHGAAPVFAYTQPQSLHISVIQREGASTPPGESYPGFYAPYASRLKRLDAAFGQFVDFLKRSGLYEDSVIVLTADHGDSLGEEGRWGHAYTIFPEVIRIPLIVHLPVWLAETAVAKPDSLAFSTDITPSLYQLLGHAPVLTNPLTGVPLFTETPGGRARDGRGPFLIASSYAPVYGVLSREGTQLFISDAVNYRNYFFERRGEAFESEPAGESVKREQEEFIRQALLSIGRYYGYQAGRGGKL